MYYCQSRYYVPELYRWLNIDNANFLKEDDINKLNLFVYCANNPVMGIDKDGHFSFLKCLAVGAAIVGAVLCVAAVTVLTAGVGTATGAVIGGAKTGWSPEGILIGAGLGFGGGAILGAVIGGASGAISHANVVKFMGKNGIPKNELSNFKNIKLKTMKKGKDVYRVWGGNALEKGKYVSTKIYSNPIEKLALDPEWGNTAANISKFVFSENTKVLYGTAASQGSLSGGGIQLLVYNYETVLALIS